MSRNSIVSCVAAYAALVVVPSAASAGPINWSLQAHDEAGKLLHEQFGITESFYGFDVPMYPQWPSLPDNPAPGDHVLTNTLRTRVTITDTESGESGSVLVWVSRSAMWSVYPDGEKLEWESEVEGPTWNEALPFVLGDHEYTVRRQGGIGILVSETPTPEPGTLLMAGLGLASGGGLWLRRQFARRPRVN